MHACARGGALCRLSAARAERKWVTPLSLPWLEFWLGQKFGKRSSPHQRLLNFGPTQLGLPVESCVGEIPHRAVRPTIGWHSLVQTDCGLESELDARHVPNLQSSRYDAQRELGS